MGKRRLSVWAASASLLVAVPLLGGCVHSRQEVLDAMDLKMPDCPVKMHTYQADQFWWPPGTVEMSYTAPKGCMDDYLTAQGVDDLGKPFLRWPTGVSGFNGDREIKPTDPPFPSDIMKRFRLHLDASRTYPIHTFMTANRSSFRVLLDEKGDTTTAYLTGMNGRV
ncbi:hypothetical protein B7P34_00390 [Streptosporangium nondiastaticum]|uniref:Lipoprotein n=1 Tax=Streptosporangium nondiastaticum TaxID=35764 RepID=A0A9X7PJT6_9ACTN|nr:hypothetical protein [Streptosporangium nondiastaticum]PSJ30517.1 hypothetical protein B7P34_00390 [Streptosporangium nondiastaticum]